MPTTRFLINPIGSHGDVDPLLAIGRELLERGHEVIVLSNAIYRDLVQSLGMQFVRVGKKQEMRAIGTDPRIRNLNQAWKVALRWAATGTMRETYQQIVRRQVKDRTVIVSAVTSFGARIASEKLGIPLATVMVDPDKLRGTEHSPVAPPLWLEDWVPCWLKRMQFWIADRVVIDPIVGPPTNEFRRELGLPPVKRFLHRWWFSPQLVIGLFDDWFAPKSSDWPNHVHLVGPVIWNPPSEPQASHEIMQFVRGGEPPVAFIAGSAGPTSDHFFHIAAEAVQRLGCRAIFLHNNPEIMPESMPDSISYCRYYSPLNELLAECSALVHHAGTGTAFHALLAGIPQLVSPQAFDQPDIAMRLRKLEVSETIPSGKFTSQRVAAKLRSLLSDNRLKTRCRKISQRLQDRQPAKQACDLLEQLSPVPSSPIARVIYD